MTRRVLYDPFGARLEGYRAGVNDETGLQSTTRQARQSDWQYNYLNPLQLESLQRENDYGRFFAPLRRQEAQLGLDQLGGAVYDAERPRRAEMGRTTGNFGPMQGLDDARYPNTMIQPATQHAIASPANQAYDAWMSLLGQEGIDPTTAELGPASQAIADQYQAMVEQQFGLGPGSLMVAQTQAGPQQYETTPGVSQYVDPYTGRVTNYSTAPNAYEQRAWMPEAQQQAEFQLRQDAQRRADEYLQVQQGWQALKAGQGAPASGTSGEAEYSDSDTPYYMQ